MTGLIELETAVPETEAWISSAMQQLGWHDREKSYLALILTLHALRDCLGQGEAIYLGAQLPTLLRGLYYDGWHAGPRPAAKGRTAFLERIHSGLHRDPGIDAEHVARAILALLAAKMPPAELEEARAATPRALRPLWPS